MTEPTPLTGGCLCGAVRYRIDGEPGPIVLCHCSLCRKAQGGAFAVNAPVRAADFHLLAGAEVLTAYASSPGKWRSFCARCGSPIHSRRDDRPEVLRLRIGTLDTPIAGRPAAHIHVASKAGWWTIDDDLPQHAGVEPGRA
ncbi:GFA family protein [uncultured Methylibium sp.]|uniref:GFA family protein n=1 Tax=uncultured Methylibium sp. TaxID=381093 RepID=UPI0025F594AF|nr:GFA family protein [uncultured Methylibium sp.]